MVEKLKKYKIPILILVTIFITIITTKIILNENIIIDNIAYKIFIEKLRNDNLTLVMNTFTTLSNTETIIIITIILTLIIKNKKIAMTIPLNLVTIVSINQILKFIFKRPRPTGYRLLEIGGYSFPSGHAMISMAFYGLLIYLSYKFIKNHNLKVVLIIINTIIIIFVGTSRIYLGVHYCSDVLVGYSISIIYLLIYTKILKKYKLLT